MAYQGMADRVKRAVALGMAVLWLLLVCIGFSDEFSFLHGSPWQSRQVVRQGVSSPLDQTIYVSDEVPAAPTFAESDGPVPASHVRLVQPIFSTLSISDHQRSPGKTKLFQLLSTYRI
jgi:hypothetical protein